MQLFNHRLTELSESFRLTESQVRETFTQLDNDAGWMFGGDGGTGIIPSEDFNEEYDIDKKEFIRTN